MKLFLIHYIQSNRWYLRLCENNEGLNLVIENIEISETIANKLKEHYTVIEMP